MSNSNSNFQRIANRVSVISIIVNLLLSALKLLAGIFAHSSAMISDAIHSASDVFSTFVVIIGIRLSAKQADKEHPYGHERIECAAAIILAMVLCFTGLEIGVTAAKHILNGDYLSLQPPGLWALLAAVISILCKEGMYWYTRHYAKQIDSSALMADAWHHRSDSFSSIGALIGIGASMLGYPIMDSVASLVIFLFILKAAYDIFKDALDKMLDHACDETTEKALRDCALSHPEVLAIDRLTTRIFGNKIYVDLEIQVKGTHSLNTAHRIAETIHDQIEAEFPKVKHIMIHVNPENSHR